MRWLLAGCAFVCLVVACRSNVQVKAPVSNVNTSASAAPAATPSPPPDINEWLGDRTALKREWARFERSQKYRLAQPADRKIIPGESSMSFMIWWGAEAYQGDEFLIAIVVDPSRTDTKRFGMVVIAAPDSAGRKYKPYWVAREEDMSGWTISVASGSVFIRQYRDDAAYDTKSLAWYRSKREFRLKSLQ